MMSLFIGSSVAEAPARRSAATRRASAGGRIAPDSGGLARKMSDWLSGDALATQKQRTLEGLCTPTGLEAQATWPRQGALGSAIASKDSCCAVLFVPEQKAATYFSL